MIREKTLEFSSTVLPALSMYLRMCTGKNVKIKGSEMTLKLD